MSDTEPKRSLARDQYAALAGFRFELRRFLAFSEAAATQEGLPPQQHQALLAIAGRLENKPTTVGDLAEQLLIAPHTATELVSRMVEAALLAKAPCAADRRRMELSVTSKGRAVLERLSAAHLQELESLEPSLVKALHRALRGAPAGRWEASQQQD